MQKVDGMPLYWLAHSIGQLVNALSAPNATLYSIADQAQAADFHLDNFIHNPNMVALPLSKGAADEVLLNLRKLFEGKIPASIEGIPTPLLSPESKNTIFVPLWNFQAVLGKELPELNIFFVTQHRDRDMNLLINNGELALSQKTLNALSHLTKDDVIREIREAARCLAFDVPTAVGLHLCRAVEVIITKEYFPSLGMVVPKNRNLGRYITALGKNINVGPKVISKLNDFKDYYRNRITHPEEYWDIDDADSAFGTAINVIDALVKDIVKIKKISNDTASMITTLAQSSLS